MRRLVAIAVSLALVLVVGLVVLGSSPPPPCQSAGLLDDPIDIPAAPVKVDRSGPVTARVASWNTLYANSSARVVHGLETIAKAADVIGVQELSSPSRRATVERAMTQRGWKVSAGRNAVQILFDARKFRVLAQGSEQVIDVVRIEPGTAGTSIGPKSIQWVQLQDRDTGGVLFVVNHHIVPDIDRRGHPRKAPKRLAVYERQMAAALSVVRKLRPYGPVAVTGDHNVDARADGAVQDPRFPFALMRRAGINSNWSVLGMPKGGTQTSGRRLIDYVWLTRGARFTDQAILGSYGSDHKAVVATVTSSGTASSAQSGGAAAVLPANVVVQIRGRQVTLDAEQISIAATTIAEGKALGIPAQGWVVALAAAGAESGIRNLDHGDRDSVGPWQMRPSTGWGTVQEIRTVTLAARAFYGLADHTSNPGLVDVPGWQQMSVTQAAQAVERSAFPDAYSAWEAAARTLVDRLSGTAPSADCGPAAPSAGACPSTGLAAETGLTPDAVLVLRCVKQQFPSITTIGGVRPDPLPDHPSGRAVDFMIPDYETATGNALGWEIARWLRQHQRELGVKYVIFDRQIWNIQRDDEGWRSYPATGGPSQLHTNHVHVTVFGNQAEWSRARGGSWNSPLAAPFTVGCGFGCYRGHTGQDYPATPGTPVYAVSGGVVIRSESITTGGTCSALPICGGTKRSYGNLVVIQLSADRTVTAWYAHLNERRVRVGDVVSTGQLIGTVGWQGNVRPAGPRGSHLHFEIRTNGRPVNPLTYLRSKGVKQ